MLICVKKLLSHVNQAFLGLFVVRIDSILFIRMTVLRVYFVYIVTFFACIFMLQSLQ